MNLGIHDAIALGRALSIILEGGSAGVLDAYAAAQRPVAEEVISTTNLLTKVATAHEHLRAARNLAVSMLDPLIRSRLAWRLSLLGYNETRETIQAAQWGGPPVRAGRPRPALRIKCAGMPARFRSMRGLHQTEHSKHRDIDQFFGKESREERQFDGILACWIARLGIPIGQGSLHHFRHSLRRTTRVLLFR